MPKKNTRRQEGPLRFVTYLRCSSDDQAEKDYSTIDTQRSITREYVAQRGGQLIEEYVDEGRSGTTLDRPGWKRLLADAQTRRFDVVVASYMSRLGRGKAFTIAEYELEKHDVRVEMVREQFADDMAGYIGKNMTVFMDGIYTQMVREWTMTKMEQMVAKGYACGMTPFGYTTELVASAVSTIPGKNPPKRRIPHPDDAPIVRQAFRLALEQRTLAAVRDFLRLSTNRKWSVTSTKHLLQNEAYIGVLTFGDWRNEHGHEPIVERDLWDAVQRWLSGPVARPPRNSAAHDTLPDDSELPGSVYRYYLRGRVHCPHCDCVYTQASARKTHYYVCLRDNKREGKCPVARINADALHFTVLSLIERAAKHHTVMHALIADSESWNKPSEELIQQRKQLQRRSREIEQDKKRILSLLVSGRAQNTLLDHLEKLENDTETVGRRLDEVEGQIAALDVRRPTAEAVQACWSRVMEVWPQLSEDEKAEVLGGLVEEVTVEAKNRVVVRLSPIAELHGQLLAINADLGARRSASTNYVSATSEPVEDLKFALTVPARRVRSSDPRDLVP